jgi:hypothetical protein
MAADMATTAVMATAAVMTMAATLTTMMFNRIILTVTAAGAAAAAVAWMTSAVRGAAGVATA